MEVKLQKWGNSYGIRIPKSVILEYDLKENQPLDFIKGKDKFTLAKKLHTPLKERMENYDEIYDLEYFWKYDKPAGKEIW